MKSDLAAPASGHAVRLGALLAVLGRRGELLYLSPELQKILQFGGVVISMNLPFWSVLKEHGTLSGRGSGPAHPPVQRSLVQLYCANGLNRTALDWPPPILVSVNVSGRQFEHPGFAAEVATILAQSGRPPIAWS